MIRVTEKVTAAIAVLMAEAVATAGHEIAEEDFFVLIPCPGQGASSFALYADGSSVPWHYVAEGGRLVIAWGPAPGPLP